MENWKKSIENIMHYNKVRYEIRSTYLLLCYKINRILISIRFRHRGSISKALDIALRVDNLFFSIKNTLLWTNTYTQTDAHNRTQTYTKT